MAFRTLRRSRWSSPSVAGAPASSPSACRCATRRAPPRRCRAPAKCARNAKAFAADPSVVAVLGPVTSTCTGATLPIVNRAPGGALPVISMSSTYLGLTRAGPGVAQGDPDALYPTGAHSFARIVPADDVQGAASALYAQRLGVRRPYVLHHDETWGAGVATAFRTAATRLGMDVAGMDEWDRRARDYTRLAQRVRRAGADGVYVAGYAIADNGARLIKDLRGQLGSGFPSSRPTASTNPPLSWRAPAPRAEGVVITLRRDPDAGAPARGPALRAGVRAALRRPAVLLLGVHRPGDARCPGRHRGVGRLARRGAAQPVPHARARRTARRLRDRSLWRHDADGHRRVPGARARLRLPRSSGRRPTSWAAIAGSLPAFTALHTAPLPPRRSLCHAIVTATGGHRTGGSRCFVSTASPSPPSRSRCVRARPRWPRRRTCARPPRRPPASRAPPPDPRRRTRSTCSSRGRPARARQPLRPADRRRSARACADRRGPVEWLWLGRRRIGAAGMLALVMLAVGIGMAGTHHRRGRRFTATTR